ncbi:hypothetical protein L1887_04148 [Cichorium endivia]|nr:hypothetical protein L1887_04148 [Cichorium endivia]
MIIPNCEYACKGCKKLQRNMKVVKFLFKDLPIKQKEKLKWTQFRFILVRDSNSYRFASGSTSEKSGTPKPRSACSKITQSIKQDNQADL